MVLLVDDLVTQADSKLEAIRGLEGQGLIVRDVVVLVDREQGGIRQLARVGYRCHAALKLSDILSFYLESRKITKEDFDRSTAYLQTVVT